MFNFDIVVIGNGILGLSTAYALALEDPSLKVAIVGPSNRLNGASIAAGAMLGCFGEVTQATFRSDYGLAKLDMAVKANKMWPEWINHINCMADSTNAIDSSPGTFIILNSISGKLDSGNYSAIIEGLKKYNHPYNEIDPLDVPGINPIENYRPLRAMYIPDEGSLNSMNLFNALHSAIDNCKNLYLIDTVVDKINVKCSKVISVKTATGDLLSAKQFLICTGAYTQALIDQLPQIKNYIPKILSGVGYALILNKNNHNLKQVVRTPNRAGACGIHLVPRDYNSLYLGASNYLNLAPESIPKARYIYYLLQFGLEQINQNFHNSELLKVCVGNRPTTVDGFPLIGETSIKGLWLLTGTYRDGLQDSPLLAKSIARQMLGGNSLFDNKFQPERMPIQTMTREEAIKEVTFQLVSTSYEHSMMLPRIGWDNLFEEMIYARMENLYDKLDIDYGLPPDVLIMINRGGDEYISMFKEYYKSLNIEFSKKKDITLIKDRFTTQVA